MSTMSGANSIAKALNNWVRDGLDIMGGADGAALNRLLDEYFISDGEEGSDPLPGSKHYRIMNNNNGGLVSQR